MARRTNLVIGDRIAPFPPKGARKYGVILEIHDKDHIDWNGKKKKRKLTSVQWYDNLYRKVGPFQNFWLDKLVPYEPMRHPLTTIFSDSPPKKELTKKKRKRRV